MTHAGRTGGPPQTGWIADGGAGDPPHLSGTVRPGSAGYSRACLLHVLPTSPPATFRPPRLPRVVVSKLKKCGPPKSISLASCLSIFAKASSLPPNSNFCLQLRLVRQLLYFCPHARSHHLHSNSSSACGCLPASIAPTMSAHQAPLRASECASAGSAYPPISTPTIVPPSNPCITGYTAGTRLTIYTLPYNFSSVLPLISSFRDISWTGLLEPAAPPATTADDPNSVPLNGTNNEPGTARSYRLSDGAKLVETLLEYSSPTDADGSGQLVEVHNIAPLYQPLDPGAVNVSLTSNSVQYGPPNGTFGFYAARDGMHVSSACDGAATYFNLTAEFCATNVSAAERWLRSRDFEAMGTLGRTLGSGGQNVTNCADLAGGGGGSGEPTPSSAASHQQVRMSMGTAASLVLAACIAFAALMA